MQLAALKHVVEQRVARQRYPGPSLLDRLERSIGSADDLEQYVMWLVERVSNDAYPSPQVLDRLERANAALVTLRQHQRAIAQQAAEERRQ